MRADIALVEKGFATSRNRAQELIAKGRVFLLAAGLRKPVTKPSQQIESHQQLEVNQDQAHADYVSRGGLKMKGALEKTRIDVRGFRVLDLGISTGGFTDCLFQAGVRTVVGVDVGHGQLAQELHKELEPGGRLKLFEGTNARDLSSANLLEANGGHKFDLIVIDVSFISLTLVLPEATHYLLQAAPILALVKPQFEVGREGLGKNGIVKNVALYNDVELKIRTTCDLSGLTVEDYFESSIEGSDGNREFFVYARAAQLSLLSLGSVAGVSG